MLLLKVGSIEAYDEATNEFVMTEGTPIELEHSLVSLSKWESKYEKPFLGKDDRSNEETVEYIRCMTLTPNVPPELYSELTERNINEVSTYINAKMTATWFSDANSPAAISREIITAEVMYYWLIALTIPFECQHWHLNRLITLVKVCNQKNQPQKKMNRRDLASRNRQLNAARKAQMGTTG